MILSNVKGSVVDVTMSQAEAQVLFTALTIAKIHVGEDVMLGGEGKAAGLNVEHLRDVMANAVRALRD